MRCLLSLAVLVLSLHAAAEKPARPSKGGSLSRLLGRVSAYLNAEPVRRARISAAVAGVRGGIPTEEGEDLDQRLLDRVAARREWILQGRAGTDGDSSLRSVYSALAVSQWIQAIEKDPAGPAATEARQAIKSWSKVSRQPELGAELRSFLENTPLAGFNDKALVQNGWGQYCRSITPSIVEPPAQPSGRALVFDPETARLEEMLKSLKRSWLEKALPARQEAEAHFLAGQIYAEISRAPLEALGAPVSTETSRPKGPGPSEPPAKTPRRVVSAPEPAAPEPEFLPRQIYGKASRAVVLILCASPDGSGELGSGSVLDAAGRILTNAHVVILDSTRQPWPQVRVYLKPEKVTGNPKQDLANPLPAKVLSWDSGLDLALIQLEKPPQGLATVPIADPEEVVVGDRVAAIGHPEQGGLWTLTTGVISTLVADLGGIAGKNAFQTDASINRGNSGGPLLNSSAQIIGVNTLMSRKAADGLAITAVNFAVKSDVAKRWLEKAGSAMAYARPAPPAEALPAAAPNAPLRISASAEAPREIKIPGPSGAGVMVTEGKPYDRDKLIEEQIKEMEDLESELRDEVRRRTQ